MYFSKIMKNKLEPTELESINLKTTSITNLPRRVFFHIASYLDSKALFCLMLTSKSYYNLTQLGIREHYNLLIREWEEFLKQPISRCDYGKLKDLSIKLYQRGLFSKIVSDIAKVNLKATIIPALLENYEFKPCNHIYLELASHLLFFNKSSDILFAQDGGNYDKFPSTHKLEDILAYYAKQTSRDSFYLIYTSSAKVIYFNKLTQKADIFVCPHAGWGIYGLPKDHIFSVLLYRSIGHVDCLVDVPDLNFLNQNEELNDNTFKRTIKDGSLFIEFYKTYIQKKVDNEQEYDDFVNQTHYRGHYLKTNPASRNGNPRNEKREEFIDYLQEQLFPVRDNNIYNTRKENRTPILSCEIKSLKKLSSCNGDKKLYSDYFSLLGKGLTLFTCNKKAGLDILNILKFPVQDNIGLGHHLKTPKLSVSTCIAHRY